MYIKVVVDKMVIVSILEEYRAKYDGKYMSNTMVTISSRTSGTHETKLTSVHSKLTNLSQLESENQLAKILQNLRHAKVN